MKNEDDYIRFNLLGETFTIKSDVSKKYFLTLVRKLEEKIKEIRIKFPNLSNLKVSLFTALDFADELSQLREKTLNKDDIRVISELSDSLASAIDDKGIAQGLSGE